jgi:hypothetical protein
VEVESDGYHGLALCWQVIDVCWSLDVLGWCDWVDASHTCWRGCRHPDAVPKGVQNPPAFKKCLKISEPESLLNWHAFVLTGTRVVLVPWQAVDGWDGKKFEWVLRHSGINTATKSCSATTLQLHQFQGTTIISGASACSSYWMTRKASASYVLSTVGSR